MSGKPYVESNPNLQSRMDTLGEDKAPYDISNIVADICILESAVRSIKSMYCNRKVDTLTDSLA